MRGGPWAPHSVLLGHPSSDDHHLRRRPPPPEKQITVSHNSSPRCHDTRCCTPSDTRPRARLPQTDPLVRRERRWRAAWRYLRGQIVIYPALSMSGSAGREILRDFVQLLEGGNPTERDFAQELEGGKPILKLNTAPEELLCPRTSAAAGVLSRKGQLL